MCRERVISDQFFIILNEAAQIVGVELYSLEKNKVCDLCERQKGINITARQMKELNKIDGKIKVFAGGNTVAYINSMEEKPIEKSSVIVKSRGNIDFEFYDKPFTHKNELWSYSSRNDEYLNIKFLYYYLKNNVKYFKDVASITGTMPQISVGVTDDFIIPIPPLEVQLHVINILDKFSTITNDLNEGLPAEIKLREQQYEYYREMLLSFPH